MECGKRADYCAQRHYPPSSSDQRGKDAILTYDSPTSNIAGGVFTAITQGSYNVTFSTRATRGGQMNLYHNNQKVAWDSGYQAVSVNKQGVF